MKNTLLLLAVLCFAGCEPYADANGKTCDKSQTTWNCRPDNCACYKECARAAAQSPHYWYNLTQCTNSVCGYPVVCR